MSKSFINEQSEHYRSNVFFHQMVNKIEPIGFNA